MEHPGVKEYVSSLSVSFVETKCQWDAKFLICHLWNIPGTFDRGYGKTYADSQKIIVLLPMSILPCFYLTVFLSCVVLILVMMKLVRVMKQIPCIVRFIKTCPSSLKYCYSLKVSSCLQCQSFPSLMRKPCTMHWL